MVLVRSATVLELVPRLPCRRAEWFVRTPSRFSKPEKVVFAQAKNVWWPTPASTPAASCLKGLPRRDNYLPISATTSHFYYGHHTPDVFDRRRVVKRASWVRYGRHRAALLPLKSRRGRLKSSRLAAPGSLWVVVASLVVTTANATRLYLLATATPA